MLAILKDGSSVQSTSANDQVIFVLPETPFHIEAGGQVAATGSLEHVDPNLIDPNTGQYSTATPTPLVTPTTSTTPTSTPPTSTAPTLTHKPIPSSTDESGSDT